MINCVETDLYSNRIIMIRSGLIYGLVLKIFQRYDIIINTALTCVCVCVRTCKPVTIDAIQIQIYIHH